MSLKLANQVKGQQRARDASPFNMIMSLIEKLSSNFDNDIIKCFCHEILNNYRSNFGNQHGRKNPKMLSRQ